MVSNESVRFYLTRTSVGGHSVVTFAYDDNSGTANDYLIVKTGWSNPAERAYSRNDLTRVTAIYPN